MLTTSSAQYFSPAARNSPASHNVVKSAATSVVVGVGSLIVRVVLPDRIRWLPPRRADSPSTNSGSQTHQSWRDGLPPIGVPEQKDQHGGRQEASQPEAVGLVYLPRAQQIPDEHRGHREQDVQDRAQRRLRHGV